MYFFGRQDCPETINLTLRDGLVERTANQGVDMFYVGCRGLFDAYLRSELKRVK